MTNLSVIIPAYNEERRLPATLESVYDFLTNRGDDFEILVVDDGSLDRTADVVDSFRYDHPRVRLISYNPNQGKGHAVRTGVLQAEGTLVLIDDADGASPIEELTRLEHAIAGGAQVAIGSRAKPDPARIVKAQVHRKYIGNTFNLIVQSLLLPGFYDTQCGFKLFTRSAARDIFSVAILNGYGFDVEALHLARLQGYNIEEVAIDWTNQEGSKVNVLVDSPKMLLEILGIKWRTMLGRYRTAPAGSTANAIAHPNTACDDGSARTGGDGSTANAIAHPNTAGDGSDITGGDGSDITGGDISARRGAAGGARLLPETKSCCKAPTGETVSTTGAARD